jgi:hypothetical protein
MVIVPVLVSPPLPVIVPLVQVELEPLTVSGPLPPSVPPLKVKLLLSDEAADTVNDPPEIVSGFPHVRLSTETFPFEVILAPGALVLTITSSAAVGSVLLLQL